MTDKPKCEPSARTTLDQQTARLYLKKYGAVLKPFTKALLKYLTNGCYWRVPEHKYMDRRDYEVSLSTIANELGCTIRTALKHIAVAEEKQLITVHHLPNGRNAYSLHLDCMKDWRTTKEINSEKKAKRRLQLALAQRKFREKQKVQIKTLRTAGGAQ